MQYPGSAFKVPELNRWLVIVSGDMIEDMRRATDDQLSFLEAVEEVRSPCISTLDIADYYEE